MSEMHDIKNCVDGLVVVARRNLRNAESALRIAQQVADEARRDLQHAENNRKRILGLLKEIAAPAAQETTDV